MMGQSLLGIRVKQVAFIGIFLLSPFLILAQARSGIVSVTFTDSKIQSPRVVCLNCFSNGHFQQVDSASISEQNRSVVLRFENYTGTCELNFLGKKDPGAEFIANPNESIQILADLSGIANGVIATGGSIENQLYYQLKQGRDEFNGRLNALLKLRQQTSPFQRDYLSEIQRLDSAIEQVKDSVNLTCDAIVKGHEDLFVNRVTRNLVKLPTRSNSKDGGRYDTHNAFLHEHYFDFIDFNDPETFHHYALNYLLEQYFAKYSSTADRVLYNSCDMLMKKASANAEAQDYIYNFLVEYGLSRNMEYMVSYMKESYGNDCELRLPASSSASLKAMNNTQIGSLAPDILLYDQTGSPQSLNRFVKDHDYTILLFWISWCSRCHKELPKIAAMQDLMKKSRVGLFTVCLDENPTIWKDELSKYVLPGTHVSEQVPLEKSNILAAYGIRTTPTLLVLDADGKIIAKNLFGDKLEDALKGWSK